MNVTILLFKNESGDPTYVVDVFLGKPSEEQITKAMKWVYDHDCGDHWTEERNLVQPEYTLIHDGDNYQALYADGKLLEQGSETNEKAILNHMGIKFRRDYPSDDYLENVLYFNGFFPDNLSEIDIGK